MFHVKSILTAHFEREYIKTFSNINETVHHTSLSYVSTMQMQTDQLKHDIRSKVLMQDLEEIYARPTYNHTAMTMLSSNVALMRENTTRAVSSLEAILYLIRTPNTNTMKQVLGVSRAELIYLPAYFKRKCLASAPFCARISYFC